MRALHARLIFTAFLGVSVAISYNAIFRQTGPHPTPLAESQDLRPTGSPAPSGTTGDRADGTVTSDTVRAIQRELTQRGYEPGAVDGVMGWSTRAAIIAYQHDNDLPTTGAPSMRLLQNIVLGESTATPPQPSDVSIPKETVRLIRSVQKVLADLGYGPGPVDGIMGDGTRRAIESFERNHGLTPTGRISGAFLRELIRITGSTPEELAAR